MSTTAKRVAKARPPLDEVALFASELRESQLETAKAQARFDQAVRRAASSGRTQLQIAEAAGLSRQRISQVLAKGTR